MFENCTGKWAGLAGSRLARQISQSKKKHNGELIWSTFCYSLPYLISFQVQNVKYGKNTEKGRKNIQVWYGVAQTQVSDQRNHHYMLYTSTSQG